MDYTVEVHQDDDGMMWAEVLELPGCFVSGADIGEIAEAAQEAITLYLQSPSGAEVVSLTRRIAERHHTYAVSQVRLKEVCEA